MSQRRMMRPAVQGVAACMSDQRAEETDKRRSLRLADSASLSRRILHCANRSLSRTDFLHEVSKTLMDFSTCDAVEIRLSHDDLHYRWEAAQRPQDTTRLELVNWTRDRHGRVIPALGEDSDLEVLCRHVAIQRFDASRPSFTNNGSFWTGDTWERMPLFEAEGHDGSLAPMYIGGHYRSLAVIRFLVDEATIGLLLIKSERPQSFTREDVEFYESAAQTIGLAATDWRAKRALTERVKELTCLYGIAQVVEEGIGHLDEMLGRITALLPPAWQYPEIAAAQVVLDGKTYGSPGYAEGVHQQSAEIIVGSRPRGIVNVVYLESRPEFVEGAFLPEEEKLIGAVAREVGLIVERMEAAAERANLQQQLIHADRLATIGQLAAGVAHELNEPLGSILGFAQLAKKCPQLPPQAGRDIEKIVTASLYAREVIRKLMVFARQVPARKESVNLNQAIEDGLYFLEARCSKGGVRVVRELARDLPQIVADPAQVKQILVNLVVNAVQAMPQGGTLTIGTRATDSSVELFVEDTGTGMSEEILEKIFLPFFTTKDVSEGTGLGLSVVHGIVAAHGGAIEAKSRPGLGTRFEIRLPVIGPEETRGFDP
jgi:signal transduction histidine kinase